eukprot:Opistho-1_new@18916
MCFARPCRCSRRCSSRPVAARSPSSSPPPTTPLSLQRTLCPKEFAPYSKCQTSPAKTSISYASFSTCSPRERRATPTNPRTFKSTRHLQCRASERLSRGRCSGTVQPNDTLLLGPDALGQFQPVSIKSIHRKRTPVNLVRGGQAASFALKKVKRGAVRKGMVLAAREAHPVACREFEADILVLHHPTTIGARYQAMVHCGPVRQTASLQLTDREHMRTGDKATVRFRLVRHPECIPVGARIVFREGRTKAVGTVTRVLEAGATTAPQAPRAENTRQQAKK